jgi:hypothetical protein
MMKVVSVIRGPSDDVSSGDASVKVKELPPALSSSMANHVATGKGDGFA